MKRHPRFLALPVSSNEYELDFTIDLNKLRTINQIGIDLK